jgi:hypothetical protein
MTRRGKIARLPRGIREELNRRLDNGEEGRRLLVWLNGLPEVREVVDRDFEGQAVSHCNLTQWKQGGFREWQAQQEALVLTRELMANGSEVVKISGEIVEAAEAITTVHYAAMLQRSTVDSGEDSCERFERLRRSLLDMVRLRRCEQARERVEIQRGWLELEQQRSQGAKTPETAEAPNNTIPLLTEEEKTEVLKELLLPKDEAGNFKSF